MAAKKTTPETVQFHEGRMSIGWAREYSRLSNRVRLLSLTIEGEMRTGLSLEEIQQHQLNQIEATEELHELAKERDLLLAKVIKSVPRSWLSEDAPENIDWSNPASLQYVLVGYDGLITEGIDQAMLASQKKAMSLSVRMS